MLLGLVPIQMSLDLQTGALKLLNSNAHTSNASKELCFNFYAQFQVLVLLVMRLLGYR